MNVKFKKALALSTAAVIGTGMITVNASTLSKTLKATYHNIKVTYDGQLQHPANEPFMVDGSVYVGLRDAGQMTNNNVSWDGSTKTVHITSKAPTTSVDSAELAKKNLEIATLKSQVADLEEKIEEYEEILDEKEKEDEKTDITKDTISQLLDKLEDKFEKKHRVAWEFDLQYDEKDKSIEFTVDFESKYDKDDFNDISASSLQKFLTDMCKEIQNQFDSVEIIGELIDSTTDEVAAEFEMSAKGKFSISREYSKSAIRNFEKSLLDKFKTLPSFPVKAFENVKITATSFYLKPNSDFEDIVFEIRTDIDSTHASAWNDLVEGYETRDLEDYLDSISDDINDFFNAKEIDGYLRNSTGSIIAKYEDGNLSLADF